MAHQELRQRCRAGECHRQHGLWVLAGVEHDPRPSGSAVGQAPRACRRRAARISGPVRHRRARAHPSGGSLMGTHFKERLCAPDARLLGMFVKFPSMESIETLASVGYDFVIIDMEHAPLGIETVYSMVAIAERSGMAALVRLRGHDTAAGGMFLDAGASGLLIPHCSPYAEAKELISDLWFARTGRAGAGGGGGARQGGL